MYCPKCGVQADDQATFCRSCGSNLSLVSQALTGELVPRGTGEGNCLVGKKPKSLAEGLRLLFTGLGFIVVAFATLYYAPAGRLWWYWMFIPAFSCLGSGIASLVELRKSSARSSAALPPVPRTGELAESQTFQIAPPPSVVEATTRQLNAHRERS